MASREGSGPAQITSAEVVNVRTRSQAPGQRRAFNYQVRLSAIDPDTGELVYNNEYRTIASDRELSTQTVLSKITELFEAGLEG
jgi:hypothetical protein